MGRLVALNSEIDENVWINASELSVAGRPLQQATVTLPRQRDLVLPESTDASSDLRLAERPRPSPEQLRAQKGRQRLQSLFSSLLSMADYQWDAPVVIVNFTGYVEDAGLAASRPWCGQCLLFLVCVLFINSVLNPRLGPG